MAEELPPELPNGIPELGRQVDSDLRYPALGWVEYRDLVQHVSANVKVLWKPYLDANRSVPRGRKKSLVNLRQGIAPKQDIKPEIWPSDWHVKGCPLPELQQVVGRFKFDSGSYRRDQWGRYDMDDRDRFLADEMGFPMLDEDGYSLIDQVNGTLALGRKGEPEFKSVKNENPYVQLNFNQPDAHIRIHISEGIGAIVSLNFFG